ncbi:ShlB/FhaC/HecB family hemolysin secretion/activation protein [Pelatocladus sp. BLCC-F211]|uniref:ShlB/FhaC/HecB family hemolysin secretion/activation protein n=1 Tax=Pelatocladus sp. BLCC-F211 TaxID=3342752 RepID=UPI0035B74E0F
MVNIYNQNSFCWVFIFCIFSIELFFNSVQAQTLTPNQESQLITTEAQFSTKIRVKKIIFKGNTVFSSQQLQKIVAPYLERDISFDELLAARKDVTQFYIDKGYTTSGAFIPSNQFIQPQGAVVTIQIIEGKLEDIKISGDKHIRNYVRSKLHKVASGVVNTNQLAKTLQLLQTDPLIEKISAQLSQGSQLGKSFLDVKVEARPPFRVEVFADNSRSPAIGSFQRGVQLTHANLFGLGDSLSFGYRNTDGSNAFEVGYSVPINSDGGTIHLGYTTVNSNVIQRPFNRLDIIGDARAYNLTFRQPLLLQINENSISEFALGITASRQESDSELLGTPFALSRGADEAGRTRISALRFFQEWSTRGNQELVFARSQFSLGIGALDATINDSPPDSRFFAWQGQAGWLRRFGDASLLLRADLQLADRPLVPLEQFGLGGAKTVRGYRQDAFLTDNGFLFSAEVRIPIVNEQTSQLQVIPFFDLGTTWNNGSPDELTNASGEGTLASVGLGLQYQLGERFNARLDWGIPLIPLDTPESNTWQEQGLYFSVRYQPF